MKTLVAMFTLVALAFGAIAPIHAQGVIPYIPSVHHGYDGGPVPANAYAKSSRAGHHAKRHHETSYQRYYRAEVAKSYAQETYYKAPVVSSYGSGFVSIHEWEDQDYRGPFQNGTGN
jgi:hypothetical protein